MTQATLCKQCCILSCVVFQAINHLFPQKYNYCLSRIIIYCKTSGSLYTLLWKWKYWFLGNCTSFSANIFYRNCSRDLYLSRNSSIWSEMSLVVLRYEIKILFGIKTIIVIVIFNNVKVVYLQNLWVYHTNCRPTLSSLLLALLPADLSFSDTNTIISRISFVVCLDSFHNQQLPWSNAALLQVKWNIPKHNISI